MCAKSLQSCPALCNPADPLGLLCATQTTLLAELLLVEVPPTEANARSTQLSPGIHRKDEQNKLH